MDSEIRPPQSNTHLSREELIRTLIKDPRSITNEQFIQFREKLSQSDWIAITRRIFDINEGTILNRSEASLGLIGKLNRWSQAGRKRKYYRRIHRGFRAHPGNRIILAEGDSWFEYPIFIREIIDWLNGNKGNAVYSLAYGADWLSNMIYDNKYIEALPIHEPEFLLISGGGNDLVGEQRLATVLRLQDEVQEEFPGLQDKITAARKAFNRFEKTPLSEPVPADVKSDILSLGKCYLRREFHSLLLLFEIQYTILLERLSAARRAGKFLKMNVLTQGYDYPYPNRQLFSGPFFRWPWNLFFQGLTNKLTPNGVWLLRPMMTKGIVDRSAQRAIMFAFIEEYNHMLIRVVSRYEFAYHIDCRGMAPKLKHWYNELHPHSRIFKQIANAYQLCFDNCGSGQTMYPEQSDPKVVRVREFLFPAAAG